MNDAETTPLSPTLRTLLRVAGHSALPVFAGIAFGSALCYLPDGNPFMIAMHIIAGLSIWAMSIVADVNRAIFLIRSTIVATAEAMSMPTADTED